MQAHAHALCVYVPSDHPQVRVGSIPGPGWRRGFPCTRATRILTPLSASVSLSGLAAPLNGQIRPLMPTTASQRQSWEVRLWCHVFRGFFFFFFNGSVVSSASFFKSEPPAMQGAVAERVGPGKVSGLRSLWWVGVGPGP